MIFLQTDKLKVSIAEIGAEVQSLCLIENKINYLWSGNANYWGKFSPVLFPIVGGLRENTYYYKGKSYNMPRHGFARDKMFACTQISDSEVFFTLVQDEQTLAIYPFAFQLTIKYKLHQNFLTCKYEVYNPANTDLYFSIGAHPAFAVPLNLNEEYNNYYLCFNKPEKLFRYKIKDGLLSDEAIPVSLINNRLQLSNSLFYDDAIVLKNLNSNKITLENNRNSNGLHFHFEKFSFFGIWAAKDASFVCLEPSCGITDAITHNQQFIEKEGINKLSLNEVFSRSWSVECF